ncbi:MAG: helix-turn-helix domain-containing protein [Terracidiphilus sp.]
MRIRPIRTEADHDAAVERIQQLMGAAPGTEESDELDVLATLVDAFEARAFPMRAPDPATVIQFQMEQLGLTRKDLEPMIGSRARVSEVLTGKRALTLTMIYRLHEGLGIPFDLLIRPVPAPRRSTARSRRRPAVSTAPAGSRAAVQAGGR